VIAGTSFSWFKLDVQNTDTISSIKAQIESKEGISADRQRLVYKKQVLLDDNQTLQEIGCRWNSRHPIRLIQVMKLVVRLVRSDLLLSDDIIVELEPTATWTHSKIMHLLCFSLRKIKIYIADGFVFSKP
jgi:hypothetical protein